MLLVHGFILLIAFYVMAVITEEFFVPSLDEMSKRLKLSSAAAGATLMAVGSSAPEFFTSLFAVLRPNGVADIGAGTIVGSAIFNILVIVGAAAMIKRAKLTWHIALRDIVFYIFSILALLFTFYDGKIVLTEALFFILLYVVYVSAAIKWKSWFKFFEEKSSSEVVEESLTNNIVSRAMIRALQYVIPHPAHKRSYYLVTFGMSIVFIAYLSHELVNSAVAVGDILSINPAIIALTVLAAGTSVPDLLSSIIVARQGRGDMAISNAVGSNIFDILFALGFPWMLVLMFKQDEVLVGTENLMSSIFLLFATVIALLFILIARKWKIGTKSGLILILTYIAYLGYNVFNLL